MTTKKSSWIKTLEANIFRTIFSAPWYILAFIFNIFYGFRIENADRIPKEGPFILGLKEGSLAGVMATGYFDIRTFLPLISKQPPTHVVAYMQERFFSFGYFERIDSILARYGWTIKLRPLISHSAGKMTLGLLDGIRCLKEGGVVYLNPEGESRPNGTQKEPGKALAWLGLLSAVPIYPAICTNGTFEVWPPWQRMPSIRGRFKIIVGEPYKLSETPLHKITDEDLEIATERIKMIHEEISYGEGGSQSWVGKVLLDEKEIENPIQLKPIREPLPSMKWERNPTRIPARKRGVAWLLWQCPVCNTRESLIHDRPILGEERVECQACGTIWLMYRPIGNDFRMKILHGHKDIVGLDMPLSNWYNQMKEGFLPTAIKSYKQEDKSIEEIYLLARDVSLFIQKNNQIFSEWLEKEAPKVIQRTQQHATVLEKYGDGSLMLSKNSILWQNSERELEFKWASVNAVYRFPPNTFALTYGMARYQIPLKRESSLMWLTHAAKILQKFQSENGHTFTTSPY